LTYGSGKGEEEAQKDETEANPLKNFACKKGVQYLPKVPIQP